MESRKVELVRERPRDVPSDWRIFNAPRPLYGHMNWQGDFVSGIFYVAVNPDGEYADTFIRKNHEQDAIELVYLSQQEWDNRVDAYGQMMADEYGINIEEFDRKAVEASYRNYLRQQAT